MIKSDYQSLLLGPLKTDLVFESCDGAKLSAHAAVIALSSLTLLEKGTVSPSIHDDGESSSKRARVDGVLMQFFPLLLVTVTVLLLTRVDYVLRSCAMFVTLLKKCFFLAWLSNATLCFEKHPIHRSNLCRPGWTFRTQRFRVQIGKIGSVGSL